MAATAVNDREPKDKEPKPPENPRAEAVRKAVWEKVKDVPNRVKVDIKRVFGQSYRVNVWGDTGKTSEGGFFTEKLIVKSFLYVDVPGGGDNMVGVG